MRMPYTQALIAAIPKLDAPPHTPLRAIPGLPPDPTRPSPGCAFAPRCAYASRQCRHDIPQLKAEGGSAHQFACWHPAGAAGAGCAMRSGDRGSTGSAKAAPAAPRFRRCCALTIWWWTMPLPAKPCMPCLGCSFSLARGETLGLVGESGCGKSTLARAVLQLAPATSGHVVFDGIDLTRLHGAALRALRRRLQIIFQDPIASLNPRRRIEDILAEPLLIAGVRDRPERERRIGEVLTAVGLDPDQVRARFRTSSPAANASASPSRAP